LKAVTKVWNFSIVAELEQRLTKSLEIH